MNGAFLRAAGFSLPGDRVPNGRTGRRCAARPDEDAVTLAAEATAECLSDGAPPPAALVFASLTPPYDEGGSAQPLAELTGLPADLFTVELTASARDGLAALRVALALCEAGAGPVLVVAAHLRREGHEREAGDGAVALLVDAREGCALLSPGPVHTEELREQWRLRGDASPRNADPSFTAEFGSARAARLVAERSGTGSPLVCVPSARAAARTERALGGPGDELVARTGILGAAHPLLRLTDALERGGTVVAGAGGLADAIAFEPRSGAPEPARRARERATGGQDADAPLAVPSGAGFEPYSSAPRAWRERGADLRLEGIRYGERLVYPPPPVAPPGEEEAEARREPLARRGRVLTQTRDHVYPGGDVTTMAVLELDDGASFYCQVTMGDDVGIGDRVALVPRRLHAGGGAVQYFWKARPIEGGA